MNELDPEYYISQLSDPWGEESVDETVIREEGLVIYKQQSIIQTIGTSQCKININLFLDEVLLNLTDNGKLIYLRDCFLKLIEVYGLMGLEDEASNYAVIPTFTDDVVNLLKFIEVEGCQQVISDCLPFMPLSLIDISDHLVEFLNINYDSFMMKLKESRYPKYPIFFMDFFMFASIDIGIQVLIKLITKYRIEIHANQITKGAEK